MKTFLNKVLQTYIHRCNIISVRTNTKEKDGPPYSPHNSMKHTKENIIKVLQADAELCRSLQKIYEKENDQETADKYMHEAWALNRAINIIEDPKHLNEIAKALKVVEINDTTIQVLRALREHLYCEWLKTLANKKATTSERFHAKGRYDGLKLAICLLTDKDYFVAVKETLTKD